MSDENTRLQVEIIHLQARVDQLAAALSRAVEENERLKAGLERQS